MIPASQAAGGPEDMYRTMTAAALALCVSSVSLVTGQTKITPPKNKYTVQQDVQLGREAAAEVEKEMPILRDGRVDGYVESVGERLVAQIPSEFRHNGFRYTFDVVNLREINAFALPGGPMYAHRGMLEKARTEGEVAGVLAHEISHVALRHGTAQASQAGKYQLGQAVSGILGAIIGGKWGQGVSTLGQVGFGAAFLRYSREYEKQADILGAQIMARAGYDPRDMASMFRTIEQEGSARGPEWLSNHPNPGNRAEYISREAQMLRVTNPRRDSADFRDVQAALARMSPAPSSQDAARGRAASAGGSAGGSAVARVPAPSGRFTTYNEGGIFRIAVPSNWQESAGESSVTFAPEGGHRGEAFTHGVQAGILPSRNRDLQGATEDLIASFAQANPQIARAANARRGTLGGRPALRTLLANVSDSSGRERIALYTATLRDGSLFYLIGVAPESEFAEYDAVITRVAGSVQFLR
jgi:Zn-dependent protease with chaperone function